MFFKLEFGKRKKLISLIVIILLITSLALVFKFKIRTNPKSPKSEQDNSQIIQNQNDIRAQKPEDSKFKISPSPQPDNTATPTSTSPPAIQELQDFNFLTIQTASKANFIPNNLTVTLDNSQAANSSAVNLEFGSDSGTWYGMGLKIIVPAGWEIVKGSQLPQNTVVGEGYVEAILLEQPSSSKFNLYNLPETKDQKAIWLIKFDNPVYGEKKLLVGSSQTSGHLLTLDGPVALKITSPVKIKLRIFSNTLSNPKLPSTYQWKIEYIFGDGSLETSQTLKIQ